VCARGYPASAHTHTLGSTWEGSSVRDSAAGDTTTVSQPEYSFMLEASISLLMDENSGDKRVESRPGTSASPNPLGWWPGDATSLKELT